MRHSVTRLLIALTTNKCADIFVSPKTVMPGLVLSVGFAPWVVSWIVPIREAFALLPQGILSIYLRTQPSRHIIWRRGMLVQLVSLLAIITLALGMNMTELSNYTGVARTGIGLVFLGLLATFSIGRSICSLTFKDIQADLVDKGRRGRLVGMASSLSGLLTLTVAIPLIWFDSYQSQFGVIGIITLAMLMFLITFVLMFPVKTCVETPSPSPHDKTVSRFIPDLDKAAWHFMLVRGLMVHSALVAPFFMMANASNAKELMVYFIAAEAMAGLVTANVWGKLADYSARSTLRIAGLLAITACIGLMLLDEKSLWTSTLLFFTLSVAHTGVRTGRKTYSLDLKEGQQRTELVGSSNAFIGIVLIGLGSLYAVIQASMQQQLVWIMAAMLLSGVVATFWLDSEKS